MCEKPTSKQGSQVDQLNEENPELNQRTPVNYPDLMEQLDVPLVTTDPGEEYVKKRKKR